MTFNEAQTIYPETMDPEVKTSAKKTGGFFFSFTVLLILAIIIFILCVIIGVACYYGGEKEGKLGAAKNARLEGALGTTEYGTDSSATTEPGPSPEELRLPTALMPLRYDLKIKPYLPSYAEYDYDDEFTFDGEISISMRCDEPTSIITLNSVKLNITEDSVVVREANRPFSGEAISVEKIEEKAELEMVLFHLGQELIPGWSYTISMKYQGPISEKLAGFYRSHYVENGEVKWLGVTQFQPTDARKAFPGFDEPHLKAVFGITIEHPAEMKALSNAMNISTVESQSQGWLITKFGDSPKMSSYLVAWAVCEFEYTAKRTKSGTLFRIWSRPSLLHQTEFAAETGPKMLDFYDQYYNIKFPLEKQDMIALPDFEAGAMENWGLITYREAYLLYDPNIYSLTNKNYVAIVVAHELAHQWFGNLVTTKWWDDLWLNEGFASLMEYIGTENATNGIFSMMIQFVRADLQRAMGKDQLASSHPMSIYIGKAYDVYEIFDVISYQKGASIIRMVMEVMGHDAFRTGLSNYLRKYSYSNADHNDLWTSLSKTATVKDWNGNTINISEFAGPWTVQMGFPLVTVTRDYNTGSVTLTQGRFKLDPNAQEKEKYRNPKYHYRWYVPLWYKTPSIPTSRDWLPMDQSRTLQLNLSPNSWILMNAGVKAYHRTQYDVKTWNLLADQLNIDHTVIPVESRSQLIDDAFTLAKKGDLSYETALNLTRYLLREDNYIPWTTAIGHMHDLAARFLLSEAYGHVTKYMLKLMSPVYEKFDFNYVGPPDDVLIQKLQSLAIGDACGYGHSGCLDVSMQKFKDLKLDCGEEWTKLSSTCNKIPTHLRSSVYCSSVKKGDSEEWDFLWKKYLVEDISVEKDRITHALACSKQPWILTRLLNKALEGNVIRHQDSASMFFSVATNSVGRVMMWNYFNENWDYIVQIFGDSFFTMNYIIKASTAGMDSLYAISQLDHFMKTRPKAKKYGAFKETLEKTKINEEWIKRNYEPLSEWFKSQS